jgi:predicted enzyme related to lactoylglutathione lyase
MPTKKSFAVTRVIFFGKDLPALARFYRNALGLKVVDDTAPEEWIELDAGACRLALHRGKASASGAKLVFGARDVKDARARIIAAGADANELMSTRELTFCDFTDPAGNRFQVSNRGIAR